MASPFSFVFSIQLLKFCLKYYYITLTFQLSLFVKDCCYWRVYRTNLVYVMGQVYMRSQHRTVYWWANSLQHVDQAYCTRVQELQHAAQVSECGIVDLARDRQVLIGGRPTLARELAWQNDAVLTISIRRIIDTVSSGSKSFLYHGLVCHFYH